MDLVVLITDHSSYDYEILVKNASFVFDTRNATKNLYNEFANIELL